jgi:histidyl-tRNA synthetase
MKELFKIHSHGNIYSLRPEGTAGIARAVLNMDNNISYGMDILKLFYHGPMFRHEQPQKGRYRQVTMKS